MQVHPLRLWYTQIARLLHAHHDDRRRHVDLDHGIQVLRVRKAHEAVLLRRRRDLLGRTRRRKPRIWIGCGDTGEWREEATKCRQMLCRRPPLLTTDRIFE